MIDRLLWRALFVNNLNNRSNAKGNNNLNSRARLVEIVHANAGITIMKTFRNLYDGLCSYENLQSAFRKSKKGKSSKQYVIEFEKSLEDNLLLLRSELLLHSYKPQPLKTFILREPKTRKISKSDFRDRIVHHALCNIIEPIFDKNFIHDSYANRKGKGTLKALQRFDFFKRKVSCNGEKRINYVDDNDVIGYILKADIKHYFEEVDHQILLNILKKKIRDDRVIWLIKQILNNHKTKIGGKGMPLGNLTSQFFANIYLNELDQFIKQELKAKYYIRYVDDFIILHDKYNILEKFKAMIDNYLTNCLKLELHPNKSKIILLRNGINFLGYRVFYHFKLLRKINKTKFERNFSEKLFQFEQKTINRSNFIQSLQGWLGYAMWANTYKLRANIINSVNVAQKIQNN